MATIAERAQQVADSFPPLSDDQAVAAAHIFVMAERQADAA